MAQVTRSTKVGGGTTLGANTVARAADVETDMLTLFTAHNNHDTAASTWTAVSVAGSSTVPLTVNNSTGTQNVANFQDNGTAVVAIADGGATTITATGTTSVPLAVNNGTSTGDILQLKDNGSTVFQVKDSTAQIAGTYVTKWMTYKRPTLKWVSVTTVDVESNTGTANETRIIFPDGEVRDVTENTGSTSKYRRFIITEAAEYTSGTENSGLYSGLAEATNTWYAIYAVKSLIDATKFVLVGTTTLPVQASVATLNTNLGTNGWVYLGLIVNGDNAGATGDICDFRQIGAVTYFKNAVPSAGLNVGIASTGIKLATTAGATTLTYTYAAGTGAAQFPSIVLHGVFHGRRASVSDLFVIGNSADTVIYFRTTTAASATALAHSLAPTIVEDGCKLSAGASSVAMDIMCHAFSDVVLGAGTNPFI